VLRLCYIDEHATPEQKAKLDSGEYSINKLYTLLHARALPGGVGPVGKRRPRRGEVEKLLADRRRLEVLAAGRSLEGPVEAIRFGICLALGEDYVPLASGQEEVPLTR
jgi:hypothetical protein